VTNAPAHRQLPQRPRRWLVGSLLALLVVGQAVAVVRSEEYWPFSPYPMYAELQADRDFSTVRLVAVTNDGRELSLDAAWLRKSLAKISRREDAPFALKNALASYVKKYGWRRPGDPRGSPNRLRAIRVYEQRWSLQPDASNATTRPDELKLLAEIRRAPDGGIDGL
jgi:hypothetical protein